MPLTPNNRAATIECSYAFPPGEPIPMRTDAFQPYQTRTLSAADNIPYDLLLLADEAREVVDTYVNEVEIHVLENNSQIIALYALQTIGGDTVEIKSIAVDQQHQGQGIGAFLLRDATRKAKEKGFKTMLIGTANAAIKQLYLYQKEGFEISHIRKNFFVEHYPKPIVENGILCKHMIVLTKEI